LRLTFTWNFRQTSKQGGLAKTDQNIFRPQPATTFKDTGPLITCVRCHVRSTALETEALALPVREFGTVCHVAGEHLTSATDILKHY